MSRSLMNASGDGSRLSASGGGDGWLLVGSVCLLAVSLLPVFVAPVLVHVLVQSRGVDLSTTGILIGLAQGGLAVGALGSAPLLKRIRGDVMGLSGAAVTGCCWLALAGASGPVAIGAVQVVLGLGAGLASAAGNGTLARARRPTRAFSVATIAVVLIGSILVAVVPDAEALLPGAGFFAATAGVAIVCPLLAIAAGPVRRSLAAVAANSPRPRSESGRQAVAKGVGRGARMALVITMLMAAVGNFAVWTFVEEIGIGLGLAEATATRLLGLTQMVGLSGALLAAATGGRIGRVSLLPPSLLLLAVGNVAMGLAGIPAIFIAGMVAVNMAFYCLNPLLFARAAELDPVGRLAAVVGGASLAGSFVAPVVGGFLVGPDDDWTRLCLAAAVTIVLSVIPAVVALRALPANPLRGAAA